jgi:hypothetical protein
MQERQML